MIGPEDLLDATARVVAAHLEMMLLLCDDLDISDRGRIERNLVKVEADLEEMMDALGSG